MSKPTEYAGETDSKRLARLAIYSRVSQLQPASVRSEGAAVVLAGPDAGELGCLRDYLGYNPGLTCFVDWDTKSGLRKVEKEWPDAATWFGDVHDVVRNSTTKLSLLHLDYMGYLNEVRENTLKQASSLMQMWGMVFYTFFRGRERKGVGFWNDFQKVNAKTLDGKRFIGGARIIQEALGTGFVPVFSLRYTSVARRTNKNVRKADMGILGFQKVPRDFQRNNYWLRMLDQPTPFGGAVPTDARLLQEYLRMEALDLRRHGHDSKAVSAILNIGAGKVAAWFANSSRGKYNS